MYAAVILIQILAVSVGGYVNFVLEGPCPEKYYGSPKCYTYTYRTNNPSNRNTVFPNNSSNISNLIQKVLKPEVLKV